MSEHLRFSEDDTDEFAKIVRREELGTKQTVSLI